MRWSLLFAAIVVATIGTSAGGQLPNASPDATALGAYIGLARGYNAVAWNPANLGLPSRPGFTATLFAVHGASGLSPVSLGDVASYSGKILPAAQREQWLRLVADKGNEHGSADGGVTLLGLSVGQFGMQLGAMATASAHLNPDAFEAIMFGNAGRTGSPALLDFRGSYLELSAFTTAAVSYGFLARRTGSQRDDGLAFGVTAKRVLGNALALGRDEGTSLSADTMSVNLPMVFSRPGTDRVVGSGTGFDLGASWSAGRWHAGVVIQNIVNTFAWDGTKLRWNAGSAFFDGVSNQSDFSDKPYTSAPSNLRDRVAAYRFHPVVGTGIAVGVGSRLTLAADLRHQTGNGILIGPKSQASGGADLTVTRVLHLRAGVARVTDGWGGSTGASLAMGPLEVGVGAAVRIVDGIRTRSLTVNAVSFR